MLTQNEVRALFDYRDGSLFWRSRPAPYIRPGSEAGHFCRTGRNTGRIRVGIKGKLYLVHRLVFLYHHGYSPEGDIDHIDRNPSNNRIENLREVSRMCNLRNSKKQNNNTSGVRGVSWCRITGDWRARVKVMGKEVTIFHSGDFTDVVAHRLAAEQCLGWPGCDRSSTAFQYMREYLSTK